MTRTLRPCLLGIAAGLLWASVSNAEPSAADRATARSLATEGYWALHDKRYAEAADRFGRADALVHAPTLTLDWARSLVGLGQFVEAQERYELIIREGVDPKAPASWQRALSDAKTELGALKPRLAWVTITVGGAGDAHVTIDGTAMPSASIGVRRPINPGTHDFAVSATGYLSNRKSVTLSEGQDASVALELQVDPNQQPAEPLLESPKSVEVITTTAPSRNRTPAYVAFGVGAAGLIVGGVSGALWLGKRSTLEEHCGPNREDCPPEYQDTVNAYDTLGFISGTGFAVGVAGVATGVTLWLLDGSSNQAPARGLVVRPYVGVGSVGAVGSF